jgi:threonyl-tRNA synthetase
MFKIYLKDGSSREFSQNITGLELAQSISVSLAKKALAVRVNGILKDVYLPLEPNSTVEIITPQTQDGLEIIRHDTAHLLAEAVKILYPNTQVTIGPVVENGFYYDFAQNEPFSLGDLEKIEAKMLEIAATKKPIIRHVLDRNEAIKLFEEAEEFYKAKIIARIPENEQVSVYKQGDFVDLCRGPHAPNLSFVKYFKLLRVSAAYWEGDSKNESLQRIYGTAWATKEDLDAYLNMLEEAEKRDHRKLGRDLDLFHISNLSVGSVFWHEKGFIVYNLIQNYIRGKLEKNGYIEVKTPLLMSRELWEKSGHWEKFQDNMFVLNEAEETLALKPMNCPGHIEIFKQGTKSYRDLPLRMAEFGSCHRNESSGSLHGIMRVRNFTQDDAHIFCTLSQVKTEVEAFCKLLTEVYKDFGFNEVEIFFSTRPEKRAGTDEVWDVAEQALSEAVRDAGFTYTENPGEGAFYGPKLEFQLKDAIGRKWQCGTIQLDFILPQRLSAFYIDESGAKKNPVVLHRAILGTFERFIGILIENCAGKFPLWLAPIQVAICTITNRQDDYARTVFEVLKNAGIRAVLDINSEKINYKIRQHMEQKVPIIAILGDKEEANRTVALRKLDGGNETEIISLEDFIKKINESDKNS